VLRFWGRRSAFWLLVAVTGGVYTECLAQAPSAASSEGALLRMAQAESDPQNAEPPIAEQPPASIPSAAPETESAPVGASQVPPQQAEPQSSAEGTTQTELETITVKPSVKPVAKPAAKRPPKRQPVAAPSGPADPQLPEESSAEAQATGAVESAWGPVDGYIASQSATATKTDTPILETPQGISVVGQEQIQQQGAQSVEEALTYTSGVRAEVFGFNPVYGAVNIRGFDAGFIFRDGLQTSSDVQLEPFGVERIEVLKGPASVMYGESPPGGIVNAVSKRPLEVAHRFVEGEYGNFERLQGNVDVGGPISPHFFYRLTAVVRDSDTQVDFVPDDRIYVAPAFTFKPTDRTTFTWLGYYQKDDISFVVDVPAQGSVLPNPPYGKVPLENNLGIPYWDTRVNDIYSTAYELEHKFTERFKVRQALRYTDLDIKYRWSFPDVYGRVDQTTLALYSTDAPYKEGLFTVDTNAVLKFNTGRAIEHTFLFGTDYRWAKRDDKYSDVVAGTIDIYHPVYPRLGPLFHWEDNGSEADQLGYYVQDQIKIGKRLTVLAGGRQDYADRMDYAIDFSTDTPIRSSSSQADDAFTWRAGGVYLFDSGLAPYFSYATSFEPSIGVDRFDQPFEPTTGEQYEAGVKFQPKGKQSFIAMAYFDITQANVLTTDPFDPDELIQTGEVTSEGFEAEATVDAGTGLKGIATYTYTHAIVTESEDPLEEGTRFEAVPLNMASLWLLYEFQHGNLKGFGLGGGVRYVGETFNRYNTIAIPSYTLFDARLQYQLKNWELSLNGRNIFDETYVSWCGDYYADDPTFFARCRYGDARTVIARASYSW
jgi:iron complex outermembrane receptor protein